jgi:hypothetical protein
MVKKEHLQELRSKVNDLEKSIRLICPTYYWETGVKISLWRKHILFERFMTHKKSADKFFRTCCNMSKKDRNINYRKISTDIDILNNDVLIFRLSE